MSFEQDNGKFKIIEPSHATKTFSKKLHFNLSAFVNIKYGPDENWETKVSSALQCIVVLRKFKLTKISS